jgi:hypothetical protein
MHAQTNSDFNERSAGLPAYNLNCWYVKIQSVPRSKHTPHTVSVIKTSQLMLYREIIAVCSEIHTEHTNTLCEQKVEFLSAQRGGT